MWSYIVRQARKGGKTIPLVENRCKIGEIDGKRYAFLKREPVAIFSADIVHFSIPENLAFEIESIMAKQVIIKI